MPVVRRTSPAKQIGPRWCENVQCNALTHVPAVEELLVELICDPEELLRVFLEIAAPHVEVHVSDIWWWTVRVVVLVIFY